jgi:hypothetical protein
VGTLVIFLPRDELSPHPSYFPLSPLRREKRERSLFLLFPVLRDGTERR